MKCDQELLWTMVEQDREPGNGIESIARHVETCDACRRKLEQYGGEPTWWSAARRWLDGGDASAIEQASPSGEAPSQPRIDLNFLDPPSHPEMLGRIGRYEVQGILGRGGMGVVLRAYDTDLQRSVAIKVLAPEWATSEPARQRFSREAQAAASVAHENVIPIYNVEATAELPYLVMRYVPGATLEGWIRRRGPLDPDTILRVAGQLAEGLAAAHRRGLVHRDIKPGNVLVGENIERVWITDFGLARAADSVTLTRTGIIAGTPHYMSPEQARGQTVDHRSDLFSLGCLLHFIAAGKPPFDAENTLAVLHQIVTSPPPSLAEVRDDLPPSFVRLVRQLLQRSVERRPADCEAVLRAIGEAQKQRRHGRVAGRPLSPRAKATAAVAAFSLTMVLIAAGVTKLWDAAATDASVPNPWTDSLDAPDESDPYLDAVAKQIDGRQIVVNAEFDREVAQIKQQLNRLEQPFDGGVRASLAFDDLGWSREVQDVRSRLNQLEER